MRVKGWGRPIKMSVVVAILAALLLLSGCSYHGSGSTYGYGRHGDGHQSYWHQGYRHHGYWHQGYRHHGYWHHGYPRFRYWHRRFAPLGHRYDEVRAAPQAWLISRFHSASSAVIFKFDLFDATSDRTRPPHPSEGAVRERPATVRAAKASPAAARVRFA